MISVRRGFWLCVGKGTPPRTAKAARAFSFGRDEKIGATVTFQCCAIGYSDHKDHGILMVP